MGVSKSASQDEIKAAFRKKAHEHHPDKGGNAEKFKECNEAYQVLGNAEKRKQYDQFGSAFQSGQAGFGGANWGGFSGFQNGAKMDFDFEDLSEINTRKNIGISHNRHRAIIIINSMLFLIFILPRSLKAMMLLLFKLLF